MQTFNQEQFPGCIYNNFFALLMANLRLRPYCGDPWWSLPCALPGFLGPKFTLHFAAYFRICHGARGPVSCNRLLYYEPIIKYSTCFKGTES